MFSVAICDDDELLCQKIESYLQEYIERHIIFCEVYYSGERLYHDMMNGDHFDLIFLDIELEVMNGVDFGYKLRTELQNEKTHIVYISAKSDYAMELFSVRPLNFLIKPVREKDIIYNLEKAISLSSYYDECIKFKKGSELYNIAYGDIFYFSTNGRRIMVYTHTRTYDFYGKLDDIQKKTPTGFIRIHKSYLVNETYVKQWGYEAIIMVDDTKLSISSSYRKIVREILRKKWEEE